MDAAPPPALDEPEEKGLLDIALPLAQNKRLLILGPIVIGLLTLGITFVIPPIFTARTTFLPPQQQSGLAGSALASLGALSSLAGAAAGIKSPADQYVSLMQSVTVQDRIIDQFELIKSYESTYRFEARRELGNRTRITLGRRDGLISVEVDDEDPRRAAAMANAFVDELRSLTSQLALTEAQQRRAFFEQQLKRTRDRLAKAQEALQASGFTADALKAEPKAAAEQYAALRAELTAAEVRLGVLRRSLTDTAPEVQRQLGVLSGLRTELGRLEASTDRSGGGPDYVAKYRDFKYEETLFELFAKQYELARVDESREGTLIQVVDAATQPEYKSRPKRLLTSALASAAALVTIALGILGRHLWRESAAKPENVEKARRLRRALSWRG